MMSGSSVFGQSAAAPITGPLVVAANPNYFKDANGTPIVLSGSQTWNTFQDWGSGGTIQALNFEAFVKFLTGHGHNFTLLWITEMPKFCGLPTTATAPPDFTVTPLPWERTGPGDAADGQPKFDLTKFNAEFFERLRARVTALRDAGVYVGIYPFTGEWLNIFRCSTDGYPLSGVNNINSVDDGYANGSKGIGSITMTSPNAMTQFQDAYVEKLIDTVNDLPNVLWIVSEEAPSNSVWWNDHQIEHIRTYESRKPFQHPVGYAALIGAPDSIIYNSSADWVAPQARFSPSTTCGSGKPSCKVNINDSDHSYWGIWKDSPRQNRNYAWQNFMSGNHLLFMDPYLVDYPREGRNRCKSPTRSICIEPDTRWDDFRDNLGYIVQYSRKLNLNNVAPQNPLSTTGYCLAQTPSTGAEYLIYSPSGGSFAVDLSAMPVSRKLAVEWFNPSSGASLPQDPITAGSSSQSFTPPFSGDAVLYLVDVTGHATSPNSKR